MHRFLLLVTFIYLIPAVPVPAQDNSSLVPLYLTPYDLADSDVSPTPFIQFDREILTSLSEYGRFDVRMLPESQAGMPQDAGFLIKSVLESYLSDWNGIGFEGSMTTRVMLYRLPDREKAVEFSLRTIGTGGTEEEALEEAVADLPAQLLFELKGVDALFLDTGILEVKGRRLLLGFGSDMGIRIGEEYFLYHGDPYTDRLSFGAETGLIRISDVQEQISFAESIYGAPSLFDQIIDSGRRGYETLFYAKSLVTRDGRLVPAFGLTTVRTAGFRYFRPLAGIEFPLNEELTGSGLPFFPYLGLAMDFSMGRFQLLPSMAAGIGSRVPGLSASEAGITHYGAFAELAAAWLVRRDLRISVSAGYAYWTGTAEIDEQLRYVYNGIILGGGLVWKW